MRRLLVLVVLLPLLVAGVLAERNSGDSLNELRRQFASPPDNARIMMRWWWFGPAVEKTELARELRVMKNANIGGVEIQPVYPLELDDPQKNFHNAAYLSDEFLSDVRFASTTAKALGMRVDITLGSGWPYGGPQTPVNEAAGALRIERVTAAQGDQSIAIPPMENGEKLLAAFDSQHQRLTDIQNGRVRVSPSSTGAQVLFFIASRTGQQVKRPSVGAEGFVLDHYNRAAIDRHLTEVGDKLMQAFGPNPPYAVFSDSLEVFSSDWTSNFLEEFQKRRGYDLTPHLPALAQDVGAETYAVRHDWGKTLTELAEEHYLTPIREWAHAHHTLFRSQTYGIPPVEMSANNLVDLPEGEHGPEWRGFSAARWASSACHLYSRPVTSTETWTWLHAPSFRATPLDMKAEADLHFIEGINQLIGHGWPYSPPSAGEPGWRFYASAAFNDHNPWFQVMPEIAKYLQRVSFLMRQGAPANDVAIYLPTDDAWAGFTPAVSHQGPGRRITPAKVSVDQSMDALLGPVLIPQILNAGYNFDFIDDRALEKVGIPYRILIVPGVERMPLATLQKIAAFAEQGGIVIATRKLPSLAPGLVDSETQTPQLQALAKHLFESSRKNVRLVPDERTLRTTLNEMLTPDFSTGAAAPVIGFIHRKLANSAGEIYFAVNTSNQPVDTQANVRVYAMAVEQWDPFTASGTPIAAAENGDTTAVPLRLAPYESRIFVFSPGKERAKPEPARREEPAPLDISSDWKVTFTGLNKTEQMTQLQSWTDDEATRFYSGTAIYEKSINLPNALAKHKLVLDFGAGEIVPPLSGHAPGMRALLESPVRESAVISINGQEAGTLWHPPYEVDVTQFVHTGENQIRILVANLAINEMAGKALPSYRLLNLRYGERFVPQGFEGLKPLPAGILGHVQLVAR